MNDSSRSLSSSVVDIPKHFLIGQMYTCTWGRPRKWILKARWGHKKTLGGVLQGTLGIHKIINLDILPGSGGRDNGFYVKNGGKNDFSKK